MNPSTADLLAAVESLPEAGRRPPAELQERRSRGRAGSGAERRRTCASSRRGVCRPGSALSSPSTPGGRSTRTSRRWRRPPPRCERRRRASLALRHDRRRRRGRRASSSGSWTASRSTAGRRRSTRWRADVVARLLGADADVLTVLLGDGADDVGRGRRRDPRGPPGARSRGARGRPAALPPSFRESNDPILTGMAGPSPSRSSSSRTTTSSARRSSSCSA